MGGASCGAGRGKGGVTCRSPLVEGRGLGAEGRGLGTVGWGGFPADLLLSELPGGCGRLRAPAGKEGRAGLVGGGGCRPRRSRALRNVRWAATLSGRGAPGRARGPWLTR